MRKIFLLLILFNTAETISQWSQIIYNQYAWYMSIQFINQFTGWHTGGLSVSKSTDGGLNWVMQISYETDVYPQGLYFKDVNYGWVVCQDGNLLRTTNGGENWIFSNYPDSTNFHSVYFINEATGWIAGSHRVLGEGMGDHRVVKTTNGGISWFPQVFDYYQDYYALYFINANTGWVADTFGRVLKTTNGGQNWDLQSTNTSEELSSIFFISENIGWISGLDGVIFKTTNGGLSWSNSGGNIYSLFSIFFTSPLKGWAVGNYNTIIATTNGGLNWHQQYLGTYEEVLYSVNFINDSVGWASGFQKIFKTTNGGTIVGINPTINENPVKYQLLDNYPNPFNPSTKIKFDVPNVKRETSNVKLIIYDVLGRVVATLVNEQLKPGRYEVEWPATGVGSNYASGIYFYQLTTKQFTETKRMVLIK